jgi:muramoyltetrapeptide carboxypeptidase
VKEGSVLAVVAPAGPFDRDAFEAGVEWLRGRYEVRFGPGIHDRRGFLAGDDQRRLAELQAALADPEVDAIVCARGGYGSTRIVPGLSPGDVSAANKLLVGFSDITALHAVWASAGVRSWHAKMVADLGRSPAAARDQWAAALEGTTPPAAYPLETVSPGDCEGRLAGGNLALLVALLGTPHFPALEGCLLFLEDVGERPYRVDRMLTQLGQAGVLGAVSGVLVGAFNGAEPGDDGVTLDDVLAERLGGCGAPVFRGVPSGHLRDNAPLPLGALARVRGGVLAF